MRWAMILRIPEMGMTSGSRLPNIGTVTGAGRGAGAFATAAA